MTQQHTLPLSDLTEEPTAPTCNTDCNVTALPLRPTSAASTESLVQQLLEGTASENTARGYARDKRYFWTWAHLKHGLAETYPIDLGIVLDFMVSHTVCIDHAIEQQLKQLGLRKILGPYKVSTLSRMLATLSREHENRGLDNPLRNSQVTRLKRQIRKLHPESRTEKKLPITVTVLQAMLITCNTRLIDHRDRALLLCGFASGGRRRSELANLHYDDLEVIPNGYLLHIRKSKTNQQGFGRTVPLLDQPAEALTSWLEKAGIAGGPVFRSVNRGGNIGKSLSAYAINDIVKKRVALAGLNPDQFSAHALRSGFLTETSRQGVGLNQATELSLHASLAVAHGYYRTGELLNNPAAHLFGSIGAIHRPES